MCCRACWGGLTAHECVLIFKFLPKNNRLLVQVSLVWYSWASIYKSSELWAALLLCWLKTLGIIHNLSACEVMSLIACCGPPSCVCCRPFEADSNSSIVSCVSVFFPESNTLCIRWWLSLAAQVLHMKPSRKILFKTQCIKILYQIQGYIYIYIRYSSSSGPTIRCAHSSEMVPKWFIHGT